MPDPLEDFAHRALGAVDRQRIDDATLEIMAAFGESGIDALLLKGPVTARWLYGPDELRGYVDCDLLAAPDRFVSAGRALEGLGFHRHVDEASHPEVWDEARFQVWHRTPDEVWVDLQWRLPGVGLSPGAAWELLWDGRETLDLGGVPVPVPDEPARALHLALGAAADPESRKAQLDLERGVRSLRLSVWEQARALSETLEAAPGLADGLLTVPGGDVLSHRLGLS